MASKIKKPSIVTRYLRSRSRVVAGARGRGTGIRGTVRQRAREAKFHLRVGLDKEGPVPVTTPPVQPALFDDEMHDTCVSSDEEISRPSRRRKRDYRTVTVREQEAWRNLQGCLGQCHVLAQAMPYEQLCMSCASAATHRCQDCSSLAFYCEECCKAYHKYRNIFHIPEKWDTDHYCIAPLSGIVIPLTHECPTAYTLSVTIVTVKGKERGIV